MKHAILKAAIAAGLGVLASGAYAQSTTAVINSVNQTQNSSNVYQFMDLGSVVTPFAVAVPGAHGRAFSSGVINQTQNGSANRQELWMGTVFAAPGSTAQSSARVNFINQTQSGVANLQRMAIGTVGLNPVTGAVVPRLTANTNVTVNSISQTQAPGVFGTPQYLSIGAVW